MSKEKKELKLVNDQVELVVREIVSAKATFEAHEPFYHLREEWKPETKFECKCNHRHLTDDTYQVVLNIKIETKVGDKNILTAEVHQMGIFGIKNVEGEPLTHLLDVYCPTTLLPYAREVISNLVAKGGFPPFYLGPMDFEAAYQKRLQEGKAAVN